ncbi:hypothetical protein D3C74_351210 [compost metagenome]
MHCFLTGTFGFGLKHAVCFCLGFFFGHVSSLRYFLGFLHLFLGGQLQSSFLFGELFMGQVLLFTLQPLLFLIITIVTGIYVDFSLMNFPDRGHQFIQNRTVMTDQHDCHIVIPQFIQ